MFLDLQKAYHDAMDRDRCLQILRGYGVGPNMLRLIKHFWDEAVLVYWASGYYDEPSKAYCGTTEGGPFSPCNCRVMINVIVREWLRCVLWLDAARLGYGEVVWLFLAILHANDAYITARCPKQL